jgi:hypothetical protein
MSRDKRTSSEVETLRGAAEKIFSLELAEERRMVIVCPYNVG